MKKVFLSSTVHGLRHVRSAASDAINALPEYKCVRMEDFTSDPSPPLNVCLGHLRGCDIYIGILGHHYGSLVPNTHTSYTEAEYNAAVEWGIPVYVFLATEDLPIHANEREDETRYQAQRQFRERIAAAHTRSVFTDAGGLVLAITRALRDTPSSQLRSERSGRTRLLFAFVSNKAGFDTGLSISNTSERPGAARQEEGTCTVYYYGSSFGTLEPTKQISEVVKAGQQMAFVLSSGGSHGILASPGFQGYLIVDCEFSNARGYAFLTDGPIGQAQVGTGYMAEIVNAD